MIWLDPLVVGGIWGGVYLIYRVARAINAKWRSKRDRALREQRRIRLLALDYRARFGSQERALRQIRDDLRATKRRLDELAVRWKASQMKAEQALSPEEVSIVEKEQREAFAAFMGEARRLKDLKGAETYILRE